MCRRSRQGCLNKFQRNYLLVIQLNNGGGFLNIQPPFTIRFNVNRNVQASMNTMDVSIYNIGLAHREQIGQDRFNVADYRTIALYGGYGDQLSLLFAGSIYEANSMREGVNVVTSITSHTGFYDIRTTQFDTTIKAGANTQQVIQNLIAQFPNINKNPVISGLNNAVFPRPVTIQGSIWDNIQKFAAPLVPYVDNNRVYVVPNNGVVAGQITQIDATTGILETPRRNDAFLEVTTLFEPRVNMGQQINVVSSVEPVYNGQYKVLGIQHQGMISDAVGGDLRSTFSLLLGSKVFTFQQVAS